METYFGPSHSEAVPAIQMYGVAGRPLVRKGSWRHQMEEYCSLDGGARAGMLIVK